jgi:uncharacterized protein YciI
MLKYLVVTIRTAQFQHAAIALHQDFLARLQQSGRLEMSGPFTDKSGGAYVLLAENTEAANRLAFSYPLYTSNSSTVIVHEWRVT